MNIEDFVEAIRHRLSHIDVDDEGILYTAVSKAVEFHSRIRPLEVMVDFIGDGKTYEWDLPPNYIDGFSVITGVEYPVGKQNPSELKPWQWRVCLSPRLRVTRAFRLLTVIPAIGETVRVRYTIPHIVDLSQSTISQVDFQAVCDLASSVVCKMLASEAAKTQSSTLGADVINYLSKVDHYLTLSKRFEESYKLSMGMGPNAIVPASSSIGDIDVYEKDYLLRKRTTR